MPADPPPAVPPLCGSSDWPCARGEFPAVQIRGAPAGRRAKVEGDRVRTAASWVREAPRDGSAPGSAHADLSRRPRPSPARRASGASPGSRPTRGKGSGPPASFRSGSGKGKTAHRLHSLEPNGRHLGPAPEAGAAPSLSIKANPPKGAAVRRGLRVREGVGEGRGLAGRGGSRPR